MTHLRDWSSTRYFVIGLLLGALVAYAFLWTAEVPRWALYSIAFGVPPAAGLLAMILREEIFNWFVP